MLEVKVWLFVVGLSVLGTAATLAYYYLGKEGYEAVLKRFPQIERGQWDRVQSLYDRYGAILLFLSSIPMIGVLLTTAAGALGIRIVVFFSWVLLGRLARNVAVLLLLDQAAGLLLGN
jgi:membrane protein YqaA with SNARE-associated domain